MPCLFEALFVILVMVEKKCLVSAGPGCGYNPVFLNQVEGNEGNISAAAD
jgi:hypothetical protein